MQVASLELCKTLWELSGWDYTEKRWQGSLQFPDHCVAGLLDNFDSQGICPAYSLGFLLRKLPSGAGVIKDSNDKWTARRPNSYGAPENKDPLNGRIGWTAGTPEDAVATMAIELFKKGILTKEGV